LLISGLSFVSFPEREDAFPGGKRLFFPCQYFFRAGVLYVWVFAEKMALISFFISE